MGKVRHLLHQFIYWIHKGSQSDRTRQNFTGNVAQINLTVKKQNSLNQTYNFLATLCQQCFLQNITQT